MGPPRILRSRLDAWPPPRLRPQNRLGAWHRREQHQSLAALRPLPAKRACQRQLGCPSGKAQPLPERWA